MTLRPELEIISDWVTPNSRILDLGCGDGALLAHLRNSKSISGYGLEIDGNNIVKCIENDVNVIQTDLDRGLLDFDKDSFDFVVMTQTLQAVYFPDRMLDDMLRVGREGIVTFPNFGHWRSRLYLAFLGRMPVNRALPNAWYNTPNIHLCTIKDFEALCDQKGIRILQRSVVDHAHRPGSFGQIWPNMFGEIALYRFQRH